MDINERCQKVIVLQGNSCKTRIFSLTILPFSLVRYSFFLKQLPSWTLIAIKPSIIRIKWYILWFHIIFQKDFNCERNNYNVIVSLLWWENTMTMYYVIVFTKSTTESHCDFPRVWNMAHLVCNVNKDMIVLLSLFFLFCFEITKYIVDYILYKD